MPEVGSASDGPLAGLVVVDLSTTLPGAQATQFLADCGAEVIMVEPPDGSPLRELAGWPALLRGKRSVTLDLHDDADLDRLRALLRRADVMVNTLRPNTADRLGLSPESLSYAVSAVGGRQCHRLGLDRAVPRLQGLGGPDHGEDRRHARKARAHARVRARRSPRLPMPRGAPPMPPFRVCWPRCLSGRAAGAAKPSRPIW